MSEIHSIAFPPLWNRRQITRWMTAALLFA